LFWIKELINLIDSENENLKFIIFKLLLQIQARRQFGLGLFSNLKMYRLKFVAAHASPCRKC
jgi:hypothetical protein